MLQWISENVGTILICMGLIVIVALIVRSLIRQKKQDDRWAIILNSA